MLFNAFLDTIVSPDLRAVAAHWNAARGDCAMPGWDRLRPSQMVGQLGLVWAFNYDRGARRFTGRLAGERIARGLGRDFRGMKLEDLHLPHCLPRIQDHMERVVQTPALYRLEGLLFRQKDRTGPGERIMLPLAADGVHGDGVLGVSALSVIFADYRYGPVELLSESPDWFELSRLTAAA